MIIFLTSYGVLSLTVQTVERRSMAGILVILRKTQNYESIKLSAINAIIASLSVVLSALSDIFIIKLSFIFKNCYRTSQNWLNTNLIKTVIKEKLKESIYSRPAQLCLFVVFSSHSRIFHSQRDVIIAGEGLQILTSWPLSSEGSVACHTYCDTGHPFIMEIFENPWHSHLLLSVYQWSCHYLF